MKRPPINEEELQKREATGIIRASRFVRKYAKSKEPIDVQVICNIHKKIFNDAWQEIAGRFREENLEISDSRHMPPHYSKVPELMQATDHELKVRLKGLQSLQGRISSDSNLSDETIDMGTRIIDIAAWIHHTIVHIHPFREGNGRTARLMANLVLERFGLVGISIKIEKENKNRYRNALKQIDEYGDYSPLEDMIIEGLVDRYESIR